MYLRYILKHFIYLNYVMCCILKNARMLSPDICKSNECDTHKWIRNIRRVAMALFVTDD